MNTSWKASIYLKINSFIITILVLFVISYVIVVIKIIFPGCSTQKMLWKFHKVNYKTPWIEFLFNRVSFIRFSFALCYAGLQIFWELFVMLLHFQMYKYFPSNYLENHIQNSVKYLWWGALLRARLLKKRTVKE